LDRERFSSGESVDFAPKKMPIDDKAALEELRLACEQLRTKSAELQRRSDQIDAHIVQLNAKAIRAIRRAIAATAPTLGSIVGPITPKAEHFVKRATESAEE
jgi:hypothetical protein